MCIRDRNLSGELDIDISFQKDNIYRRNRRLICFDMDSTLIKTEVIDELADKAGVGEEVRAITEAAMRGEIDFNESFKKRVSLLKGLDESVMTEIAENLPIMDGADRLMHIPVSYTHLDVYKRQCKHHHKSKLTLYSSSKLLLEN